MEEISDNDSDPYEEEEGKEDDSIDLGEEYADAEEEEEDEEEGDTMSPKKTPSKTKKVTPAKRTQVGGEALAAE
jgi:hypothetical protein